MSLGNEPNEVLLSLPYDTVFMDTEVAHIMSPHPILPITESMTGIHLQEVKADLKACIINVGDLVVAGLSYEAL